MQQARLRLGTSRFRLAAIALGVAAALAVGGISAWAGLQWLGVIPGAVSAPSGSVITWGSGGRVYFVNPEHGWAMGQAVTDFTAHGTLYKTSNGGAAWDKQLEWNGVAPESVFVWSPGQAVFVVQSPDRTKHVYSTTDGATWQGGDAPANAGSVSFVNAREGWFAFRRDKSIVVERTDDAGRSWKEIASLNAPASVDPYFWVRFLDRSDGIMGSSADGKLTQLYMSHDGGKTWAFQDISRPPETIPREGITVANRLEPAGGKAAFLNLTVYRQAGVRSGNQYLYYSSDGGRSWSEPRKLPAALWQALDANHLFAAAGQALHRSHDGGRSWTSRTAQLPPPPAGSGPISFQPYQFAGIEFVSDQVGWGTAQAIQRCSGEAATPSCQEHPKTSTVAIRTSDGGASWKVVPVG